MRSRSSDFTQVLTTETDRAGAAGYYALDVSVSVSIVLVYFGMAFHLSPVVTSVVALFGAALALAVRPRLAGARRSGEALTKASRQLYAAVTEHLDGMKTAVSFGAEARHVEVFDGRTEAVGRARVQASREFGRLRQALTAGSTAGLAVIVYVSLGLLALPTAELLVLLFLFARLTPRVTSVYERTQSLAAQLPAFAAVRHLEQRCVAAARPTAALAHPVTFVSDLRLDQVWFDYAQDTSVPALRGVSLTIAAGSTTAIVGPSGSGKTTLADLLLGLFAPTDGVITVDGCLLNSSVMTSWRQQVGYVPQDTYLFHESIRANLVWANPGASDRDLWQALRLAAADELVAGLPEGLDTLVGDRGVRLSGGERQRLSLARALLRQPRLLILDEATSALDSENERRIQKAIEGLHERVTIVIITHRLSTVRHADVIHVVEQGRIVESGTWNSLGARSNGRFRALLQAQGFEQGTASVGTQHRGQQDVDADQLAPVSVS
ncbi:MAG: ABC transporter ATP-binding protein [Acidobacteriota bacterium]